MISHQAYLIDNQLKLRYILRIEKISSNYNIFIKVNYTHKVTLQKPLVNTDQWILPPPQPGKLNEQHERVVQGAEKGLNCWFGVMELLRAPNEERYLGTYGHKKSYSGYECIIEHRHTMMNMVIRTHEYLSSLNVSLKEAYQLNNVTKQNALKLIDVEINEMDESDRNKCKEALKGFLESQAETFEEFIRDNCFRMQIKIDEKFVFGFYHQNPHATTEEINAFIQSQYQDTHEVTLGKKWG